MPIYAYKCTDCGRETEVLQKISDTPLTDCPACGKPALAKMVTAAGFQLKGSGWYATDFRNKDSAVKNGKTDKSDKTESANDAKADGGSAATPAAASTAAPACGSGGCASCS